MLIVVREREKLIVLKLGSEKKRLLVEVLGMRVQVSVDLKVW